MAKGGEYERGICKQLSKWWSGGERDDIFWRSDASGARATVRFKKHNLQTAGGSGDIKAVHPSGFALTDWVTIELKRGYKNWNIMEVLEKVKKHYRIIEFHDQVKRDQEVSETPFITLITRKDGCKSLIFFPIDMYIKIKKKCKVPKRYIKIHLKKSFPDDLICMNLDDFFVWCNPSVFKKEPKK